MAMVVQANRKSSEYGGHISQLRLLGDALRGGLQSLLARAQRPRIRAIWSTSRATPRPGIYARAYLEGRLTEEQLRHFRQEVAGNGLSSYPHPVADARLLAVPDRVDGPGTDDGDLPGALHPLPGASRAGGAVGPQGLVLLRRRGDGRARVDGRAHHAGAREARQPHLRRQLQPAAPRRTGARQRQDHPGARGGVSRRRLERHQGALGLALGSAAGARHRRHPAARDGAVRRRRVSEFQGQGRRVHARALLRQGSDAQGDGRQHVR